MRINKEKIFNASIKYIKYYYPILILILFFILKSHLFNHWVGFKILAFWKLRTLTSFGLAMLLSLPVFCLKRRGVFRYSIFLSFMTSLLFAIYLVYYNYVGGILSVSAIGYADQLTSVLDIAIKLIDYKVFIFFIDFFILIFLYLKQRKIITEKVLFKKKLSRAILLMLTLIIGMTSFSSSYIKSKSFERLFIPVESLFEIQKNGIINYGVTDIIRYFNKKKSATEEEIKLINDWAKNRIVYEGDNLKGIAKEKNIIIVQLESIQDFVIDMEINNQEITPNLNKFAKDNYRFNNFYFQAGPGSTSDAEFAVLNSLYPLAHQAISFDYPSNDYTSLIEILNNNNYQTILMHGYKKRFWNREVVYNNYKLDKFYSLEDYETKDQVGWGISDEDFYSQSIEYLKTEQQPFFSLMVSLSCHPPYTIPENKQELDIEEGRFDNLATNYLHASRYTDKAFGKLIEELKKANLYEESVIIVYGDHSAGLKKFTNEDFENLISKNDPLSNLDLIYERVPFLIHLPNNQKGLNNDPMSQIDIFPTITNLLGIDIPKTTLGKDMFNYKDSSVFIKRNSFMNKTIIYNNKVYLYPQSEIHEEGKCYDWKKKQDLNLEECLGPIKEMENTFKINDLLIQTNNLKLLE